jgi:hypothetical protein
MSRNASDQFIVGTSPEVEMKIPINAISANLVLNIMKHDTQGILHLNMYDASTS